MDIKGTGSDGLGNIASTPITPLKISPDFVPINLGGGGG